MSFFHVQDYSRFLLRILQGLLFHRALYLAWENWRPNQFKSRRSNTFGCCQQPIKVSRLTGGEGGKAGNGMLWYAVCNACHVWCECFESASSTYVFMGQGSMFGQWFSMVLCPFISILTWSPVAFLLFWYSLEGGSVETIENHSANPTRQLVLLRGYQFDHCKTC